MSDTIEVTQLRLHNIAAIKPLLEALKTISLGSWQSSLRSLRRCDQYQNDIARILSMLSPRTNSKQKPELPKSSLQYKLVVIGSGRGLCGKFNRLLADKVMKRSSELHEMGHQVTLQVIGAAVARLINLHLTPEIPVSVAPLPSSTRIHQAQAYALTWKSEYNAYDFDQIEVIFNKSRGALSFTPTSLTVLPMEMPKNSKQEVWPQPILDADVNDLYLSIADQMLGLSIYRLFLTSAIAEHSARFTLMEEASKNANTLIEDLTLDLQAMRRQMITQEMVGLAVGAGLLQLH